MKLIIDISKNEYNDIIEQVKKCDYPDMGLGKIIANGTPVSDITNEQISDAFQIAIATYWEEKSKYLTPPPMPARRMTNKEAIEILKQTGGVINPLIHPVEKYTASQVYEALNLAIKALENEIKKECNEIRSPSELGFQDLNDGIVDPTYIDDGVDCSDMGIFSWGD